MKIQTDILVIGLGAMGSAAMYQLSQTGKKVIGIDQFAPPHSFGSSHGDTRITRLGLGEGTNYVPLVMRSHEIWQELERRTGKKIFEQCGVLVLGKQDGSFIQQTIRSANEFDITHDLLSHKQLQERYGQFKLQGEEIGYFEPTGGYVVPETAIEVHLSLAQEQGCSLNLNEIVEYISYSQNSSVEVTTNKAVYKTEKLIVTAGAWVHQFIPKELHPHFKLCRQILAWFDVEKAYRHYAPPQFPTFIWEYYDNAFTQQFVYGFPAIDGSRGGWKVSKEQFDVETTMQEYNREVTHAEVNDLYNDVIKMRFNGILSECIKSRACMYTVTPDGDFIIDYHPENSNIIIASPCSGHGFKHSAAIGEVLADMALERNNHQNIDGFSFDRFNTER